jgi:hypothetical protein
MSRYSTAKVVKDMQGNRRATTVVFPAIPVSENDVYIRVLTPERLDLLAYRFYQDQSLWWVIASANGLGKASLYVPSNTRLRIPNRINFEEYIRNVNESR